jgi:hypothetical protein
VWIVSAQHAVTFDFESFVGFGSILAQLAVDISISWLGITGSNNSDVKKLAISSLGPLSGLSIGFFSGKIKWPG